MEFSKSYLQSVEKKLKKQGKSEQEVEQFIKNLINPNKKMEEEKVEEALPVEAEAAPEAPVEEEAPEPVLDGEAEPAEESVN